MGRKFEYIQLNIGEGMPAWKVAELAGIHENTVYNWLSAYRQRSFEALANESRAPKDHSHEYSHEMKGLIRKIRTESLNKEKRY